MKKVTPLKDTPETHLRNALQALANLRGMIQTENHLPGMTSAVRAEVLSDINQQAQAAEARIHLAIGMLESSNFVRPMGVK